jgi:hypothetical protein
MGTYRLDARAEWRNGKETGKQENIPIIEAITGVNGNGSSTESARTLDDMKSIFERASGAGALRLILKFAWANMYFKANRTFDLLALGVTDGAGRLVGTATGKDMKVTTVSPVQGTSNGQVVIDLHDSDGFSFARS